MKHILLIEDDKPLSNGIALALKGEDIFITQCYNIADGREIINSKVLNLIILDVNLPDGNGLDLLSEIKKSYNTPVIMLTANDMEIQIVTGLELGADDYITKPFSLAVLRARVNTQLRKQEKNNSDIYKYKDFSFNFATMEFYKNSTQIDLSKTEQKLLRILIENKGLTVERNTLVDKVWTDGAEYVDENALSVSIKRLRNKLEDNPTIPQYIKTVYGLGYTWVVK